MLMAGVDGVRINMSHGTQEEKAADIRAARAAADKTNRPLAILIDLSGPKIRTRMLKNHEPVTLLANQQFTITTRAIEGDNSQVASRELRQHAARRAPRVRASCWMTARLSCALRASRTPEPHHHARHQRR